MRLRERRSRISALAIVIAVTVLAVPLGGGTWLAFRDPLAALPRAAQSATVKESASVRGQGRERRRIVLNGGGLGDVRLRVSLPDPVPNAPMPVAFVLGGLRAGERSLCRLPEPGANVLVGYDWPVGERLPDGIALWRRVPDLYRQAFSVPGQVSTALRWIAAQPWADKKRISLVGLSLGALAAPAVQRVAAAQGVTIRSTVLGFGGSPFGALLANHPDLEPAALRGLLGHGVGLLMRPLDPASHLPHLEGKFLVFAGTGDTLIPPPRLAAMRTWCPRRKPCGGSKAIMSAWAATARSLFCR